MTQQKKLKISNKYYKIIFDIIWYISVIYLLFSLIPTYNLEVEHNNLALRGCCPCPKYFGNSSEILDYQRALNEYFENQTAFNKSVNISDYKS